MIKKNVTGVNYDEKGHVIPDLTLTIKNVYALQIIEGTKTEEYRGSKEYYHKIFGKKVIKGLCKDVPKVIKFHNRHNKYLIVLFKNVWYDQFNKYIPEGMKKGDRAYTLEVDQVLEHNF